MATAVVHALVTLMATAVVHALVALMATAVVHALVTLMATAVVHALVALVATAVVHALVALVALMATAVVHALMATAVVHAFVLVLLLAEQRGRRGPLVSVGTPCDALEQRGWSRVQIDGEGAFPVHVDPVSRFGNLAPQNVDGRCELRSGLTEDE
ncbi:hypothetical protein [Blastococcus atacamensis]|uniref:hypothetical protein n=1 Tax=Blastococcus atacamensis TaxID=2070508 RepID=UPI001300079E|nr:hypothetical protein [Blastococcus atacamensis]